MTTSFDFQLVQPQRERLGCDERDQAVRGAEVARVAIAVRRGLAEDPRCQPNRVDDPELANAEAGVERRLAAHVVDERVIRDLDDE